MPDDCVLLLEHTAGRARKLSSFGGTQALVGAHQGTAKKSSDGWTIEISATQQLGSLGQSSGTRCS